MIMYKAKVDNNMYLRYIYWNKNCIHTYTKTNKKSSPNYLIQGMSLCTVKN